jgi:hypothetical protein
VTLGVFEAVTPDHTRRTNNMASKAAKTKKEKKGYDQERILKLWLDGKSIAEITEAMKPISRVYVHRVLTTKYPDQYKAGVKARKAARERSAE